MISWIQQRLIRHGRWIFLVLLAIIIVAFVFTIGNTPGCTSNTSNYEPNEFYGYDLNSSVEIGPISQRVALSALLNTGRPIQNQQQFENLAMGRIAALNLADAIGIPRPDADAIAIYLRSKAAFRGPDGKFSADAYSNFIDSIESDPQTDQALVVAVLEEDYRLEQVTTALRGPGYVLPAEALAQIKRDQTTYSLSTANVFYAAFDPEIETPESALIDFYEANKLQYEIPERIEASYIVFPSENYTDLVGEIEETELRQHFISNRAQFVAEYEAANPPAAEEATETEETSEAPEAQAPVSFEDVRESVTSSLSSEKALRLSNEAAQAFAYSLYRDEVARDSAAFNALMSSAGLSPSKIEPFTAADAAQSSLSPEMFAAAFDLSGSRYYSDAYAIEGGYAVLIYEGRIAPEIPPVEAVEETVKIAYLASEKRRLFNEEGLRLKAELDAKLAEEIAFTEAAEALELSTKTFEAFKGSEAPQDLNRSVLTQAAQLEVGELSPMIQSAGEAFFVYLSEKSVPEISEDDEDVTKTMSFLKNYSAILSQSSTLNEWITLGVPEQEAN
ncbi:MAG: hypothetical protein AAGC73_10525 [Verrucomicrobiota bacterium]